MQSMIPFLRVPSVDKSTLDNNSDQTRIVKEGWQLASSSSDITLYNKDMGGPALSVRGVGIVDCPFSILMTTFFDISQSKKWVADLHSVEEHDYNKKTHDGTLLQRYRVAGGLVVKDREFLLRRKIKRNKRKGTITVSYESYEDDKRFPVCDGCVRSWSDLTQWVFTKMEGGRTKVDLQAVLDPKGSLSPILVNLHQKSWPKTSIMALKNVATKRNKDSGEFSKW